MANTQTTGRAHGGSPVARRIVLVVVALFLSWPMQAYGTGEETKLEPAATDLQAAEAYAAEYGVDVTEAQRRLSLQQPLRAMVAEIQEGNTERFAGAWFQHEPEYAVIVRFTGDEQGLEPVRKLVATAPAPVRISTGAPASILSMMAAVERVSAELGLTAASVSLDTRAGEIAVGTEHPLSEGVRADLERVASMPVRYEGAPRYATEHTYGGRQLNLSGEKVCTTGFTVRHTGTGVHGVITAAHCPGAVLEYLNGAETYPLPLQGERSDDHKDVEWRAENNHVVLAQFWDGVAFRNVHSTAARVDMVNDYVCHWGATTRRSCGTVTTIHRDPGNICGFDGRSDCAATWVEVTGSFLACAGGDSGGPWFDANTMNVAYGIHKAGISFGTGQGDCDGVVFTSIGFLSEMGLAVLFAP
jgi:streptogrisin C